MSNFEVIDRRRSKEHHEEPVAPAPEAQPATKGQWDDVAYLLAIAPQPKGDLVIIGRAVGLRMDGKTFVADYLLAPQVNPGQDWTAEVRKRLDTFLDCSCTSAGPCGIHKMYLPQWARADVERVSFIMEGPVPKAVEAVMMAEKAKKSNLVVPR